jgi:predicted nucleic acid-binding Zn ribbon protein
MITTELYRPTTCHICRKPMPESNQGRPRLTCSDRCRQIKRRRYDYHGWRYPRQHDQQWRQAERDLRKLEKVCGRLPDTVGPITSIYDPTISVRQRILIRLSRGMDVPKCLVCHKPFITEDGVKGIYCSPACSELGHNRARTLLTAIGEWEGRYDPRVDVRVRLDLPIKTCAHCTKPFPDYDKRKIYCSPRCRKAHWREEKRASIHICARCHTVYDPTPQSPQQKYCTKACQEAAAQRRLYQRKRKEAGFPQRRRCRECGRAFRPKKLINHFYCSEPCSERVKRRRKSERLALSLEIPVAALPAEASSRGTS